MISVFHVGSSRRARRTHFGALLLASLLLATFFLGSCARGCVEETIPGEPSFESAGFSSPYNRGGARDNELPDADTPREVIEADVYRFVDDRLYVLNQYRGIFVFDVENPDLPVELSRMPLVGFPVEMYVRGSVVYAILSDYFSYWRDETALSAGLVPVFGSRIVAIDFADPASPRLIGEVVLDGEVSDSRLVGEVIYAASNRYASWTHWAVPPGEVEDQVLLTSIDTREASGMRVIERLTFPGSGWAVHATANAFIVAGHEPDDRGWMNGATEIRYVDIGSPAGAMVARGHVKVEGELREDTAIDLYQNQLRVLTRSWSSELTQLRIFDASQPDTLPLLGQLDYYYQGSLFGTTFAKDRLYLIHYQRVDPLEVVVLTDPAHPYIAGVLEMPGWVDRIAALDDRLVGLGIDDTDGQKVSLSLFDVAEPATPVLLDRLNSGEDWSWSTASWERKAWTVDAEEGVILFPYSSYSNQDYLPHYALGIVELDRDSLEALAEVNAVAPVERGVVRDGRVYALSQAALQVMDIRDRTRPAPRATIELARDAQSYARGSQAGVELVSAGIGAFYGWGGARASALRLSPLQDPDGRTELSRLALTHPADSVMVEGDLVLAVRTSPGCGFGYRDEAYTGCDGQDRAGIAVVSIADPAAPRLVADLRLPEPLLPFAPPEINGSVYSDAWWQARYGSGYGPSPAAEHALNFGGGRYGFVRTQNVYCSGLAACLFAGIQPIADASRPTVTEPPMPDAASLQAEIGYYGSRTENALVILDASNPEEPRLLPEIDLGEGTIEQPFMDQGFFVYSRSVPSRVDDAGRPWVRWYLERAVLDPDGSLRRYDPLNVPGVAVALGEGGSLVLTVDRRWQDGAGNPSGSWYGSETWLNALRLEGDRTVLGDRVRVVGELASLVVAQRTIYAVESSYGPMVFAAGRVAPDRPESRLRTIHFGASGELLPIQSQAIGPDYGSIAALTVGHLAIAGGYAGGLMIFDVDHPMVPVFQRYHRARGYPNAVLTEGEALFLVSGPYGIERLSLLAPENDIPE